MSSLIVKTVTAASTVVIGLGLGVWRANGFGSSRDRNPASINPAKSASFQPQAFRLAKPNQSINVGIQAVGAFPATADQTLNLKATVSIPVPFQGDLNLQWILPENVQIISGATNQVIRGLQPGQSFTADLTVKGFSSDGERRNISVDVNGLTDGNAVGSIAVFSSHPTRRDLSIGFRDSVATKRIQTKATENPEEINSREESDAPKGLHL